MKYFALPKKLERNKQVSFDTFLVKGIDGTEILAHFITHQMKIIIFNIQCMLNRLLYKAYGKLQAKRYKRRAALFLAGRRWRSPTFEMLENYEP